MKQLTTKISSLALSITLLFASCEKHPVIQPIEKSGQLEVALNETYMPMAKIDSAIAFWQVDGKTQIIKLTPSGNKLTTSLDSFTQPGTGMLAVQLFTQTKLNDMPLQWEQRFTYSLNRGSDVRLAGPANIKDPLWNPRLIQISTIYQAEFTVITAIRPEDAYFELKGIAPAVANRIEIVRSFFENDTTRLVAKQEWIGAANNLDNAGNLVNREHFKNLAEQINGKMWGKSKIRASIYKQLNPNEIYEAETLLEKP